MRLASINHAQFLNDLIQDANRANATFYTIDPPGLAVFDTPIHRDADGVGFSLNVIDACRACASATMPWPISRPAPTAPRS